MFNYLLLENLDEVYINKCTYRDFDQPKSQPLKVNKWNLKREGGI